MKGKGYKDVRLTWLGGWLGVYWLDGREAECLSAERIMVGDV